MIGVHIEGLCPTLTHLVEGYFNLQSWSHIEFLKRGPCRHHFGLISHCLLFHNRSQSRKLLITIEPDCKRIAGLLIFHVGCVWILSIVFGLYNCCIWLITYTPPYAKKLYSRILSIVVGLCRL